MKLERLRITVLSAPIDEPIPMSFSHLGSRDMVLVELESDGLVGLGESWVNYPSWAAEERVATLARGVAPLLAGLDVSDPERVHDHLVQRLGGLARQWGAPGPIWQAISAADMALWDLAARARGIPVSALLNDSEPGSHVEAYASGIGPSEVELYCEQSVAAGFRAVKARVGFGRARDEQTLDRARAAVGDEIALYLDANQAWSLEEAREFCDWSARYRPSWLEEPVAGNGLDDIRALAESVDLTLACGENLYGAAEFARYVDSGAIGLIQPDLAKSGGFTMAHRVESAMPAGVRLAPHCYGGAIVTAASVQFAAAFASVPYIELDVRPNALRDDLLTVPLTVRDGKIEVPTGPGLGVELDRDVVNRYAVDRKECDLRAVE